MSEATSKTCEECGGRGFRGVKGGLCATCNGTGITTTGKFLGTLPSTPDPVTDEPHEPTITTTQGDAPSVVTGNGLRYVYAPGHDSGATVNATGHDGCIRGLEKAKAEAEYLRNKLHETERAGDIRIAEQAAEIERLKTLLSTATAEARTLKTTARELCDALEAERDQWRQLTVEARRERDAYSIRVNSLRADLEKARLEAQRLNDRLFAASNADAAIVAERDELRRRLDIDGGTITKLQDDWHLYRITIANLEAERNTQVEQIQRLRENLSATGAERDELKGKLDVQQEFIDDYRKTIDRLRTEVERLKGDIEELTIQRDAIDERFNAQTEKLVALDRERWDIEAERDELRTKIEMITEGRDCYRSAHDTLKEDFIAVEVQRDAAEARVTQLLLDIGSIESGRDRALYAEAEATARAEKYLAVIAAQSDMIEAQERHNEISLRLSQAYSVAGFATDVLQVGDVPRVKEADNG